MEQPEYLIDSNSVIDYLGNKLPEDGKSFMDKVIDAIPNISVIGKIEVLSFNAPDEHYKVLTDFINDSAVIDLTSNIVDKSIYIRKHCKTKLPDAIIAATALIYNLVLITRNIPDFKDIDGLQIVNPHEL